MKTLGPGSLTAILKVVLDVVAILLWILLGAASLVMVMIMVAGVYRTFGIGPELPRPLLEFLQLSVVLALPMAITAIVVFTFVVDRLRRINRTLVEGDPFVPENAAHLRGIALGIIVYQVLSYASHGVIALVFTLSGSPVEGGGRVFGEFSLNLGGWFAVIAFFVLAEVFREGARLRDEQKFTI